MPVVNTVTVVVVAGVVRALLCYCMRYVLQTVNCVFVNGRGSSGKARQKGGGAVGSQFTVRSCHRRRRSRVLDLSITRRRLMCNGGQGWEG